MRVLFVRLKVLIITIALFLPLFNIIFQQSVLAFSGGDGSPEQPYLIANCMQLQNMKDDLSANYQLAVNIDCGDSASGNDTSTWNEGDGFIPVGDCWGPGFAGTFNGNGHTITDLTINRPGTDRQSLFGCTNNGAIIEKVGMVNVDITGMRYAGGIVGVLVGSDTYLRNSYVTGNIALVYGEVGGSGQFAGGIVSGMEGGSHIVNSYSVADVSTYYHDAWGEGGISGYAYNGSTVTNSFWNTETPSTVLLTEGGGTGKLTSELKTLSTYTDASWDFDEIWSIDGDINDGYPYHQAANLYQTDLNGDIIPDIGQPNVGGYTSPITGKTVVMDMGAGCELTTDDITTEANLPTQDSGFDYQNGLFEFEADCNTPGASTTIKLYYYDVTKANLIVRKYNPNTHAYFNLTGTHGATLEEVTIDGHTVTVVTYQITDGGLLDMDGVADGYISDPAGIASTVGSNGAVGVPNTGIGRK